VLIARTDSLQSLGFDEGIARLRAAVAAGADVAFLEGMTDKTQMREVVKLLAPTPCFLNMVAGGVTPLVDAAEAHEMGFRIVIWPTFAMTAAYNAWRAAARELLGTGQIRETFDAKGKVEGGVREIFECCGLTECAEFDKEMGGKAFAKGV
jgi:2-methylisocitrate lyase-like PEP mutase family enzyme